MRKKIGFKRSRDQDVQAHSTNIDCSSVLGTILGAEEIVEDHIGKNPCSCVIYI